jgi:hypothetical protein
MSENLKNFENLKEKKSQNSALCSTHLHPKNWQGTLNHLAIGLVDDKYIKLGNIGEKVLLILRLAHINLPIRYCSNVSTTPITAMGCRQCLPLSVVQLKGKHCRKPHCRNGVVDTFRHFNM